MTPVIKNNIIFSGVTSADKIMPILYCIILYIAQSAILSIIHTYQKVLFKLCFCFVGPMTLYLLNCYIIDMCQNEKYKIGMDNT